MLKNQVLVFRKGGKYEAGENWHIGKHVLEIVISLRISVLSFYYNNKFTIAEKQLSEHGRKSLFALNGNVRNKCLNHSTKFSLYLYVILLVILTMH